MYLFIKVFLIFLFLKVDEFVFNKMLVLYFLILFLWNFEILEFLVVVGEVGVVGFVWEEIGLLRGWFDVGIVFGIWEYNYIKGR